MFHYSLHTFITINPMYFLLGVVITNAMYRMPITFAYMNAY